MLGDDGATTGISVMKAIQQATADQFTDPAIKVINMSFAEVPLVTKGIQVLLRELTLFPNLPEWIVFAILDWNSEKDQLTAATQRFVVTASAGNTGNGLLASWGSTFPANVNGVISVGAALRGPPVTAWAGSTPDLTVAIAAPTFVSAAVDFVNFGDAGESIRVPWSTADIGCFGGTSASAPEVAGGAAVLLSAVLPDGGTLPVTSIKGLLMQSATPMSDSRSKVGAGLMNLQAALAQIISSGNLRWTYSLQSPIDAPRDVTHIGEVAFFLTTKGSGITAEPATLGPGVEAAHAAGELDFLCGISHDDAGTDRFIGTFRDAGTAFGISGNVTTGFTATSFPLSGKPVHRSVSVSVGDGGFIALIPTTSGVEAVSFSGGLFRPASLVLARPLVLMLAVSSPTLPDGTRRLAVAMSIDGGVPSRVELMRLNAGTATVSVDQSPLALPTLVHVDLMAVGSAPFGMTVPDAGVDPSELPVWAADESGRAFLIAARLSGIARSTEMALGELGGMLARPAAGRFEVYAYSIDGKLTTLDSRTGAVLDRAGLGTQYESLWLGSIAASGTTMSIINLKNFYFRQPDDVYFNSITVLGL